jgi:hypothetical protein
MLSFLIARDTMHQNQWITAIAELEADGLETTPCPSTFPQELELQEVSYQFWNCSEDSQSRQGRWAEQATHRTSREWERIPQAVSRGPSQERTRHHVVRAPWLLYGLKRNSITSPSCTTYSLPSARASPCSRAGFQPPTRMKSP